MTIVVQIPCTDHQAKKIHDAILDAASDGGVTHIVIDGKPHILSSATTPDSNHSFDPHDAKKDRHGKHPHQPGAGLSYTLVEAPAKP